MSRVNHEVYRELYEAVKDFLAASQNGFGYGCPTDKLDAQRTAIAAMGAAIRRIEEGE